ncbi:hypothetical protein, partial [Helicobacter bizzozeronii]|uniref:hypothetical protein n=1 Tax=Helicobacter bizzozeronii TaxID=56877 RepID=UPI001F1966B9
LTHKDKFKKAKLLDEFEQALELHHVLAEVAHNASKAKKRSSNESNYTDSKPKRDYDSFKRAQIEHTKRLEKLATLEQKEQESTLTQQDKRKLKNIREVERAYTENKDKSSGQTNEPKNNHFSP